MSTLNLTATQNADTGRWLVSAFYRGQYAKGEARHRIAVEETAGEIAEKLGLEAHLVEFDITYKPAHRSTVKRMRES